MRNFVLTNNAKMTALGMVIAAAGILTLFATGVADEAFPFGAVILLVLSALVVARLWKWMPAVGGFFGVFVTVGGFIAQRHQLGGFVGEPGVIFLEAGGDHREQVFQRGAFAAHRRDRTGEPFGLSPARAAVQQPY